MVDFTERRHYQRCSGGMCKVHISVDKIHWEEIDVKDISAGGLRLFSKKLFDVQQFVYLKIFVYNMLSEFRMDFEGIILRSEERNGGYEYGIRFENANLYHKIQLDEVIRSRLRMNHENHNAIQDGAYTFKFKPRSKTERLRVNRYR